MPRCCNTSNPVAIAEGDFIDISGEGTLQDPWVVSGDIGLDIVDSAVFNLSRSGVGSAADPWIIGVQFAATAKLDDIPDVAAPTPTNGQVLSWSSGSSAWVPAAPTTAASGSVNHDGSLSGDGSVGTPLAVDHATSARTTTRASGIDLTDAAINELVRHFANAAAQSSASPSPILNSVSIRDDEPGVLEYWTGAQWSPILDQIRLDASGTILELSGPYSGGMPVTQMVRAVSAITDVNGVFSVLAPGDLTGKAGVLSATFSETGPNPFKVVLNANINQITGTAYRLDTGEPYQAFTVQGMVSALVY